MVASLPGGFGSLDCVRKRMDTRAWIHAPRNLLHARTLQILGAPFNCRSFRLSRSPRRTVLAQQTREVPRLDSLWNSGNIYLWFRLHAGFFLPAIEHPSRAHGLCLGRRGIGRLRFFCRESARSPTFFPARLIPGLVYYIRGFQMRRLSHRISLARLRKYALGQANHSHSVFHVLLTQIAHRTITSDGPNPLSRDWNVFGMSHCSAP